VARQGFTNFPNPRNHLKILGARQVTRSKFHTPDPQILVLNSLLACSPKNIFYMFRQQGYLTAFLKQAAQSLFFSPQNDVYFTIFFFLGS